MVKCCNCKKSRCSIHQNYMNEYLPNKNYNSVLTKPQENSKQSLKYEPPENEEKYNVNETKTINNKSESVYPGTTSNSIKPEKVKIRKRYNNEILNVVCSSPEGRKNIIYSPLYIRKSTLHNPGYKTDHEETQQIRNIRHENGIKDFSREKIRQNCGSFCRNLTRTSYVDIKKKFKDTSTPSISKYNSNVKNKSKKCSSNFNISNTTTGCNTEVLFKNKISVEVTDDSDNDSFIESKITQDHCIKAETKTFNCDKNFIECSLHKAEPSEQIKINREASFTCPKQEYSDYYQDPQSRLYSNPTYNKYSSHVDIDNIDGQKVLKGNICTSNSKIDNYGDETESKKIPKNTFDLKTTSNSLSKDITLDAPPRRVLSSTGRNLVDSSSRQVNNVDLIDDKCSPLSKILSNNLKNDVSTGEGTLKSIFYEKTKNVSVEYVTYFCNIEQRTKKQNVNTEQNRTENTQPPNKCNFKMCEPKLKTNYCQNTNKFYKKARNVSLECVTFTCNPECEIWKCNTKQNKEKPKNVSVEIVTYDCSPDYNSYEHNIEQNVLENPSNTTTMYPHEDRHNIVKDQIINNLENAIIEEIKIVSDFLTTFECDSNCEIYKPNLKRNKILEDKYKQSATGQGSEIYKRDIIYDTSTEKCNLENKIIEQPIPIQNCCSPENSETKVERNFWSSQNNIENVNKQMKSVSDCLTTHKCDTSYKLKTEKHTPENSSMNSTYQCSPCNRTNKRNQNKFDTICDIDEPKKQNYLREDPFIHSTYECSPCCKSFKRYINPHIPANENNLEHKVNEHREDVLQEKIQHIDNTKSEHILYVSNDLSAYKCSPSYKICKEGINKEVSQDITNYNCNPNCEIFRHNQKPNISSIQHDIAKNSSLEQNNLDQAVSEQSKTISDTLVTLKCDPNCEIFRRNIKENVQEDVALNTNTNQLSPNCESYKGKIKHISISQHNFENRFNKECSQIIVPCNPNCEIIKVKPEQINLEYPIIVQSKISSQTCYKSDPSSEKYNNPHCKIYKRNIKTNISADQTNLESQFHRQTQQISQNLVQCSSSSERNIHFAITTPSRCNPECDIYKLNIKPDNQEDASKNSTIFRCSPNCEIYKRVAMPTKQGNVLENSITYRCSPNCEIHKRNINPDKQDDVSETCPTYRCNPNCEKYKNNIKPAKQDDVFENSTTYKCDPNCEINKHNIKPDMYNAFSDNSATYKCSPDCEIYKNNINPNKQDDVSDTPTTYRCNPNCEKYKNNIKPDNQDDVSETPTTYRCNPNCEKYKNNMNPDKQDDDSETSTTYRCNPNCTKYKNNIKPDKQDDDSEPSTTYRCNPNCEIYKNNIKSDNNQDDVSETPTTYTCNPNCVKYKNNIKPDKQDDDSETSATYTCHPNCEKYKNNIKSDNNQDDVSETCNTYRCNPNCEKYKNNIKPDNNQDDVSETCTTYRCNPNCEKYKNNMNPDKQDDDSETSTTCKCNPNCEKYKNNIKSDNQDDVLDNCTTYKCDPNGEIYKRNIEPDMNNAFSDNSTTYKCSPNFEINICNIKPNLQDDFSQNSTSYRCSSNCEIYENNSKPDMQDASKDFTTYSCSPNCEIFAGNIKPDLQSDISKTSATCNCNPNCEINKRNTEYQISTKQRNLKETQEFCQKYVQCSSNYKITREKIVSSKQCNLIRLKTEQTGQNTGSTYKCDPNCEIYNRTVKVDKQGDILVDSGNYKRKCNCEIDKSNIKPDISTEHPNLENQFNKQKEDFFQKTYSNCEIYQRNITHDISANQNNLENKLNKEGEEIFLGVNRCNCNCEKIRKKKDLMNQDRLKSEFSNQTKEVSVDFPPYKCSRNCAIYKDDINKFSLVDVVKNTKSNSSEREKYNKIQNNEAGSTGIREDDKVSKYIPSSKILTKHNISGKKLTENKPSELNRCNEEEEDLRFCRMCSERNKKVIEFNTSKLEVTEEETFSENSPSNVVSKKSRENVNTQKNKEKKLAEKETTRICNICCKDKYIGQCFDVSDSEVDFLINSYIPLKNYEFTPSECEIRKTHGIKFGDDKYHFLMVDTQTSVSSAHRKPANVEKKNSVVDFAISESTRDTTKDKKLTKTSFKAPNEEAGKANKKLMKRLSVTSSVELSEKMLETLKSIEESAGGTEEDVSKDSNIMPERSISEIMLSSRNRDDDVKKSIFEDIVNEEKRKTSQMTSSTVKRQSEPSESSTIKQEESKAKKKFFFFKSKNKRAVINVAKTKTSLLGSVEDDDFETGSDISIAKLEEEMDDDIKDITVPKGKTSSLENYRRRSSPIENIVPEKRKELNKYLDNLTYIERR